MMIASIGLTFFHIGLERGFWEYNSDCAINLNAAYNFEAFVKMLQQKEVVSCNQPSAKILFLSLVEWNFLYSIIAFFIIILLRQMYANKK
jgi:disulfide bond formation protein DsbB